MSGIGHNKGPSMERGFGFRKTAWTKARRALLPQLPLAVIRRRVARAKELGLPYQIYATVHAASGRDITAFLFSTNALRLLRAGGQVPPDRLAQLHDIRKCTRHILVQPPLVAAEVARALATASEGAFPAPPFGASHRVQADQIHAACAGLPHDAVVLIGDTAEERLWSVAGKLAGFVPSDRYFAAPSQT